MLARQFIPALIILLLIAPAITAGRPDLDSATNWTPDLAETIVSARVDSSFYFAPSGQGSYGTVGTNSRGFDFDSSEDCTPAGWISHGYSAELRLNDYLPGINETCSWAFFDPAIPEENYPMGVYPYGPPYLNMWIESPPLELDQNGQAMEVVNEGARLYLWYDIYMDLPLDPLLFHYMEVSARTEVGDYQGWEPVSDYVMYGTNGWMSPFFDVTDAAFASIGGEAHDILGLKVRLSILDYCGYWCDTNGSGENHTLGILLDNVQVFAIPLDETGVGDLPMRAGAKLHPIVPNPFNPTAKISFDLDAAGVAKLRVCDIGGRVVRHLHSGELRSGRHEFEWNGHDDSGAALASGVYFVQLESAAGSSTRKAVLLK